MRTTTESQTLPTAIVVGLDCITGLQTVRIFARHRVPVIAIAGDRDHYCCQTRLPQEILTADLGGMELIETLERLGNRLSQRAVLVPCTDGTVLNISRHRERLQECFHVVLPEHDTVEMLMDKVRFFTFAQEADLPIPGTFLLRSRQDAEEAAATLTYPLVMKPPVKTPAWQEHVGEKVFQVPDAQELLRLYDRCSPWADVLMVQEWVEGDDADLYSCNCYFNAESEPLVTFVARKLRQWPPETGTSCLGEEIRNDTVLQETVALFRAAKWRGLGYVEMKRDRRTGKHYIIEPNLGRPTGRSAIAEAGGVELLYTMYCDAVGLPLPENRKQTYRGVKWIHLRRDIQSALYYMSRRRLTPWGWYKSIRGPKGYAVIARGDMGPFWAELRAVVGKGRGAVFGNR